MAQWKETLEPYIKVNERIRTTTIVPTAGEDLIIGATIISDSGPSYPVLITSQREFLNTFASQEITKEYIESLNKFYKDEDGNSDAEVASTMWLNAYRLAGSTNMLIVRATKGADMNYVVSLADGDLSTYIVRDGQLLKRVNPDSGFSITIDRLGTSAAGARYAGETGWAISINEIGIIGNLVGDDGPIYEYFAADLRELVEYLNGTSKFFCPNPEYYKAKAKTNGSGYEWAVAGEEEKPDMVYFKEVYLAEHFIDPNGFSDWYKNNVTALGSKATTTSGSDEYGTKLDGLAYLLATQGKNTTVGGAFVTNSEIISLNDDAYSGGDYPDEGYLVNTFNSNSDLKIRIRRFNHDAVILRDIAPTVVEGGDSPFEVITDVVDQYTNTINAGTDTEAIKRIKERDFYEVAVLDPSLDKDPLSFCVGNYPGRGDITLDELNDTLKMINLHVNKMEDLHLTYYGANASEGGETPSTPAGLPAAPAGYHWRVLNDGEKSLVGDGDGDVMVLPPNLSAFDWNNFNVSSNSYFITSTGNGSGTTSTRYVPVTTNIGTNAEEYSKGQTIEVGGTSYTIGNDLSLTETTETAEDTVVENSTVLKIDNLYYMVKNINGVLRLEHQVPAVVWNQRIAAQNSSTGLNIVNSGAGNEIDVTSVASMMQGGTSNVTDGVGQMLRSSASGITASDILDSDGDNPAYLVKGTDIGSGTVIYTLAVTGKPEIYKSLGIDVEESDILTVTPGDLKRSISSITEDEVYTTEGLTDLGNTDITFQTYLCNMAKNENYFYPISTLYSTNYLAIANYRTRLAQDSHKLYTSAPWDIDSGTVGFKFHACPSVIYWEAVSRNRSMNREFASVFGFSSNGQVLYTNPVTEFTKKQRQLLLSKQVNTVMWNTQNQTWNMNDCYTMTSENHILNEDGNSRLFIRINKAIPTLLRPLIGRKLNNSTYADAETILKYWFERTILTMQYSVSDYKVTIANLEANDDQARRQNKMYVLVECLFARSLKYVIVYSDALDMGMEFVGEIV